MGDYLQSIHYVDQALGEFLTEFKRSGLYEKTILVLLGDHDASLDDHDLALINHVPEDEFNLKQLDKVPFLIHLPNRKQAFVSQKYGGTIDVTPTLLYLLGIDASECYFMGTNLFSDRRNSIVAFRDGSVINDQFLFMPSKSLYEKDFCYRLPEGERVDEKYCETVKEEGRQQLTFSDLMIEANLIPRLRRFKNK